MKNRVRAIACRLSLARSTSVGANADSSGVVSVRQYSRLEILPPALTAPMSTVLWGTSAISRITTFFEAMISCSVIALPPKPLDHQVRSQIHNKRKRKQNNSDQKEHLIVRITMPRLAKLRRDRRRQCPHRIQHAG